MRSYSITVRPDSIDGSYRTYRLRGSLLRLWLFGVILLVLCLSVALPTVILPHLADVSSRAAEADQLEKENTELEARIASYRQEMQQLESRVDTWVSATERFSWLIGIDRIGGGGTSRESLSRAERLTLALDLLEERHSLLEGHLQAFHQLPIRFPLEENFVFTSGYGLRRSPFSGRVEMHRGIDLMADRGETIYAAGGGTVVAAGRWRDLGDPGYARLGLFVLIRHGDTGYETIYGHCSEVLVNTGDTVVPRQPIARVGNTGWSTAPHLHFAIRQNNAFVDPTFYLMNFDAERYMAPGGQTAGSTPNED